MFVKWLYIQICWASTRQKTSRLLFKNCNFPLQTTPHPPTHALPSCHLISVSAHCVDSISVRLVWVCEAMLAGRHRHLVDLRRLNQAAGMRAARRRVSDLYLSLVIFSHAAHAFVSAEMVRTSPHITDVLPLPVASALYFFSLLAWHSVILIIPCTLLILWKKSVKSFPCKRLLRSRKKAKV